ncbi:MAG TPA: DUF2341 domain-containing protein, partial [Terriglobales bacterium]
MQNRASDELHDYPVGIRFDSSALDFSKAAADGSDLAVWDATTQAALPAWVEAYDGAAGKGLIWTRVAALPSSGPVALWLTSGAIPHCAPVQSTGYDIFPFFSDVKDAQAWNPAGTLKVTNTET